MFQKLIEKWKQNKTNALFEKDFPFALMALSVELNLEIPFEKALEDIALQNYGLVSKELGIVCREIREGGSSVQESLLHLSERISSQNVKRAMVQLVNVYEHGAEEGGAALQRLAGEFLAKQRSQAKEFSGKIVIYSLVFIAFSAIIPAFFQAFVLIGSQFLELSLTPFQVMAIIILGFPALNAGMLFYFSTQIPEFLK